MLSEVSQIEKDKYCDVTYLWNLKKATLQETGRRIVITRGWVEGVIWEMFKVANS